MQEIAVPVERAARLLLPLAKGKEQELVWSLPLDDKGRTKTDPVEITEVQKRESGRAAFPMSEIFRSAVICRAVYLYVAHNHPNGDLSPSDADIVATRKMIRASKALDIILLDHIILTADGRFASVREACQNKLRF